MAKTHPSGLGLELVNSNEMDPFSITATCITLIGTIAKSSLTVTDFVRDVHGARRDLDGVSRELLSLKPILELVAADVVMNCAEVVEEIQKTLEIHGGDGKTKAARWIMFGKGDMAKLRSSLGAHKSALDMALKLVNLSISKEIKEDTRELRNDTTEIREMMKSDRNQILDEIRRLQLRNISGFMLERYLENLSSYVGTACGTVADDNEMNMLELEENIGDIRNGSETLEQFPRPDTTFSAYEPVSLLLGATCSGSIARSRNPTIIH